MGAISWEEGSTHEELRWGIVDVHDMCEEWNEEVRRCVVDMEYYNEQTWKKLDSALLEEAEQEALERFNKMGVHECISQDEVEQAPVGKSAKVKWVRINKGTEEFPEFRCRLVAQELGYGERLGELCAAARSLAIVKLLLSAAAERDMSVMLLDVRRALSSCPGRTPVAPTSRARAS